MNYPAPLIEVVANDIPNPFDENNECGASQAPKSSCKSLIISDDPQIHRYTDTKETQIQRILRMYCLSASLQLKMK